MEQHIKEVHTEHPNCPFCSVSFTNMTFLRKHIDHPDTTARSASIMFFTTPATTTGVPTTPATSTGAATTPLTTTDEEVSNGTPQEDHEEESASEDSKQEEQEETGDWHKVGRQGAKFQCKVCGYTRNTRHQLERHMLERHDKNDVEPHEPNGDSQICCDLCKKYFTTTRELSHHMSSDHKSYKPCHYFK